MIISYHDSIILSSGISYRIFVTEDDEAGEKYMEKVLFYVFFIFLL